MTGEPLTLAHATTLTPLLAQRWHNVPAAETLSDPWFANLYLFRRAHDWRVRHQGAFAEWPCLQGHAYDGQGLLLPLFDLSKISTSQAQELLHATGQTQAAFGPLAEAQIASLPLTHWQLQQQRDDADYLYDAEQFRHYRGALLHKKQNLVNQLLHQHEVSCEPYSSAMASEADTVLSGWLIDKHKVADAADAVPCTEALRCYEQLHLDGLLFRIDQQAAGFVLADVIRPGVAVMRFAKAREQFKGLYQHMFQQYCRLRPELAWLNFEQDLGLANFRQTKQSYAPHALLAKYRVIPLTA